MAYLRNLARGNAVEHITISTSGAAAESGNFSTLTVEHVADVVIQNLSAVACYVTFGLEAVTATTNDLYLAASSSVSLNNVGFIHFSVIRATGVDVDIRITGLGRV